MSRPGITYQDVANAAHQLSAQGINPTIEGIRKLTGTGSNGTLAPHLRKWKENQSDANKIASKENLPEELVSLIKGLWERVLTQSAEQFAPIEESLERKISELRQELEKYKSNNQRWQTLFSQWQQEKTQFANEKITLEQALDFSHKENGALHAKHDALFQQLQEKQERITELHRLHSQAQTNLEHYRESSREQRLMEQQRYEQHQQQLEQAISQLQQKLTLIAQDKSLLQQQYEKITFENDALKIEQDELKNQLNKLQEKYSSMEKELNESIQAKNHWQSQFQEMQKKVDDKTVSLVELQKENAILSHQLSSAQNQVRELNDQNKSLALEKWELGQEKSQLEGQLKQVDRFIKNSKKVMIS